MKEWISEGVSGSISIYLYFREVYQEWKRFLSFYIVYKVNKDVFLLRFGLRSFSIGQSAGKLLNTEEVKERPKSIYLRNNDVGLHAKEENSSSILIQAYIRCKENLLKMGLAMLE